MTRRLRILEKVNNFFCKANLLLFLAVFSGGGVVAQDFGRTEALYQYAQRSGGWLEGFSRSNNQNSFAYRSLQEDCKEAMITRALPGALPIDWNTAPVPPDYDVKKGAVFLFLADKDLGEPHSFKVYVDRAEKFSFGKPDLPAWTVQSADGGILSYTTFSLDNYGDSRGYMTLYAPPSWLHPGRSLHLRIRGDAEGSNAWFMIFKAPRALDRLRSQAAYEKLFHIHYTLQDKELKIDLKTTAAYGDSTLVFQLGKDVQPVKGILQDSVTEYRVRFRQGAGSAVKDQVLKVFQHKKLLFITDTLFQKPRITYVVTDKGIMLRRVKMHGPANEEEMIRIKYDPSLARGLMRLSHKTAAPFYLMNSSHQDIAWMDDPAKCVLMRDTLVITPLLERMARDPGYHFDIEDVLMIREYLHRHPDRSDQIRHFLDNGQLSVGGSFNMTYEDMYSGESLVREFYQGSLWMYKHFNYLPDTYWNVDVPGRTRQMPQILAGSGIKMMVLSRMGSGLFNWSAPDGSAVLTYSPGQYGDLYFAFQNKHDIYNGFSYLTEFTHNIDKGLPKTADTGIPLLWDMDMIGPGGSGIIPGHWNHITDHLKEDGSMEKINLPEIKYATSPEIYDSLKNDQPAFRNIQGERPDVWLYIHGPSHERALHASRQGDILLPAAEKFATFNALLKGNFDRYPADELHEAWEAKIYPDHGWGGKHGNITDNFFLQKFLFAKSKARHILDQSIEQIASRVKFKRSLGIPVAVFNPLSWKRDAPVNMRMHFSKGEALDIKMVNAAGMPVPCQLGDERYYADHSLRSVKVSFTARQVPALGYASYYAVPLKSGPENNDTLKSVHRNGVYGSDYYRIRLANGGLGSIYDKALHKELLDTGKFLGGEIFTMHSFGNGAGEFADIQQPDMQGFDKTSLHPCRWKIVADGPVFTALRFRTSIRYADAQLTVILYKHLKRIDFKVDILNWEGVLYREFRMALPLSMSRSEVAYQVPFGILRVGQDELHRAAGERYKTDCRLVRPRGIGSWIGAYNDSESVTLSSGTAVADYKDPTAEPVSYTVLQPILFASRKSCNAEGNEYLQTGDHHFTFSFTSGRSDLSQQDRQGISGHVPLFAVVNPPVISKGSLPEALSFLHANNDQVIITAVKKAEDADKVCVRLYNTSGLRRTMSLYFFRNFTGAVQTNLIEHPLRPLYSDGQKDSLNIQTERYGIETFIFNIVK